MKKNFDLIILLVILVAGFLVRMYRIDNPIADWHSWRQADTSAVTRNFIKFGINPFIPRYDDFSDVSGRGLLNPQEYRFVEFPLFNIFHYFLTTAFSFKNLEFWGRMTSVLAALTSSVLLFFIVRRHGNSQIALFSTFFYLFLPFNIYFTRVVLPDPLMVTLYLSALNFFDLWVYRKNNWFFLFSALFGGIAVMVKPVAIFFLLPVFWWFWTKYGWQAARKPQVYILLTSFLLPYLIWRYWENRFPAGIPAGAWLLNGDHIRFKGAFFRWIFGERIGKMILGSWGIIALSGGIINPRNYFLPWVASALLYLFTFATGNVRHDYYQIPIIPAISVTLAFGVAYFWQSQKNLRETLIKRGLILASVLFMLAFSWYDIRGNFQVNHWEIVKAGKKVDEITPKDAVVVANYNGDTAFLYQTNRRGFAYLPFPIKDVIDRYNGQYYVSVNYDDQTNAIIKKYTVVEKNSEFVIVKLVEPKL